jgi:hypothetical protein
MQGRGETLAAIAELAGVKVGEARAVLKAARAQPASRPDALGAGGGAAQGADGAAVNGAAAQALSADAVGTTADGVAEVV